MKKILLSLSIIMCFIVGIGQSTIINIGNGTASNSTTNYPTPYGNWYWGCKQQIIVLGSELTAAGMVAGDIYSIGFDVETANGVALEDFTMSIGSTSLLNFNSAFGVGFETGLTTVFGPTNYTETAGVNTHTFASPYYWDGTSNIVVETCFNNSNFSNNAAVYMSSTQEDMVAYFNDDAPGVCSVQFTQNTAGSRPNLIITVEDQNVPPTTSFTASTNTTCSGVVSFFDNSLGNPTSWSWDFGDGNTSTGQNPTHTYLTDGTYTVSLTTTNSFGNDTETQTNLITVNIGMTTPVATSCYPATGNGSLGFGITNVSFNTINKTTGDGSEGYGDFTCDQTTVNAGFTYTLDIEHSSPTFHNCAAWIDWNNDGVFNTNTEEVVSNSSANSTSIDITIPSNAVLDTPLRLRIIADYDLNAMPTPCLDPGYGQCEDYSVIVEQLQIKPDADFTADVTTTCDGVVNFSDLSTNIPYAWAWDFGDGGSSVAKNPTHTYTTAGTYEVQLIATNTYGSDTIIQSNFVTVNTQFDLTDATCEPSTLSHCCDYGIYKVSFNNFSKISDGAEDGYQDYSCQYNTVVNEGQSYNIEVRTGSQNPQDTRVWIDFNDDGSFDASEMVMEELNAYNPTASINIPSSVSITDTYLRMRVSSEELGGTLDGCGNLLRGQTEDYGVMIENVDGISKDDFKFKLFPNPTSGQITVQSDHVIETINIFNLVGELVYSLNVNNVNQDINLDHLTKGSYILQTSTTKGLVGTKKIIIN